METISGAWSFIIEAGAGLGLVLILRWYWWRVNAWSEITAMVAPFAGYWYVRTFTALQFPESLFAIVGWTTVAWLTATFLTRPTAEATLVAFFRRVHPGGILWKRIAVLAPDVQGDEGLGRLAVDWLAGVVLIYTALFGTGKLLLGETLEGVLFLAAAAGAGWLIYHNLARQGWKGIGR
jgi:solute:Na+ symporter, SSS family